MYNKKFKFFFVLFLLGILGTTTISALAAREQDFDSTGIAAYDCSFTTSSKGINGYTNVSFIVSYDVITNGFTAYSEISIKSSDSKKTGTKTAYVVKGTNYAHTGTLEIEGYSKGSSTHKMVYSAKSVNHTVKLSL